MDWEPEIGMILKGRHRPYNDGRYRLVGRNSAGWVCEVVVSSRYEVVGEKYPITLSLAEPAEDPFDYWVRKTREEAECQK